MCYLCLQDFNFELPVNPNLEQKKKRLLKLKSILTLQMSAESSPFCEKKLKELQEEQYILSRDF